MDKKKSFGEILGKTKFNVYVYSNENGPETRQENFYFNEFSGLRYECVEFARRFLIACFGLTFRSVKSAVNLWNMKYFVSVINKSKVLIRHYFPSINSKIDIGDLIIFNSSVESPDGHVAVVVKCIKHREKVFIYICDQNFNNKKFDTIYNGVVILLENAIISDRGNIRGMLGVNKK